MKYRRYGSLNSLYSPSNNTVSQKIMIKPPMLAASLLPPDVEHTNSVILSALSQLKQSPWICTVKYDGVRALTGELNPPTTTLVSRRLKRIPNDKLRAKSIGILQSGLDMELYSIKAGMEYNDIQSIVMSEEHPDTDKICFILLDYWKSDSPFWPYHKRLDSLREYSHSINTEGVYVSASKTCSTAQEMMDFLLHTESTHGEGIVIRSYLGAYKYNRSTLLEEGMIKLSRYVRSDCTIIGFEEQMFNGNSERRNAIGKMDRSKSLHGMKGKGTLGALEVRNESGIEFTVGSGFTDYQRQEIWDHKDQWLGKKGIVKHKPHGQLNKPRHPVWMGKRED